MAAKAAYLEHYLDSLETLPSELQRNFNLMRDLDTRAQEELKIISKLSRDFLKNAEVYGPDEKSSKMDKIHKLYKKAQAYADDKVQLAMQTYEMVDKHIRRLDADLARFEADLKEKALNPHSSDSETSHKKKGRKLAEKIEKKKGKRIVSSDEESSKVQRKNKKRHTTIQPEITTLTALTTMTHPSDVLDMPVDPNEPTYCFCHQVSYGEMIGCDNPDCPIEWFHFACVGLTSKPKGKWYCSKCSSERKKK